MFSNCCTVRFISKIPRLHFSYFNEKVRETLQNDVHYIIHGVIGGLYFVKYVMEHSEKSSNEN